jgi:hypothetical protein
MIVIKLWNSYRDKLKNSIITNKIIRAKRKKLKKTKQKPK